MYAYAIPTGREYQLQAPEWLNDVKFDIAATCPPETSHDVIRQMLQSMLAARFGLTTLYENKSLRAYALVVAKRVSKLQPNSSGAEPSINYGADHITARALTMEDLADRLSGAVFRLDRPVIDQTGLKKRYDFTLKWKADDISPDVDSGPSIFTALQEQLGLRLDTKNVPTRILVIDRAQKEPLPN
jgi:uncharacterized protein (TIGR03435 family)